MRWPSRGETLGRNEEEPAVHWMEGWDWAWMTVVMGFWVLVLGVVVYVAVKLATRSPDDRSRL